MVTIAELRQKSVNLLADIKNKETTVKELDKQQRAIRGEIAKLKNKWRELSSQITKLTKEEI